MPNIKVSENLYKRLKSFKKVIDAVLVEDFSEDISVYAEIVLSVGMEKMLKDILPEEESLQWTMVQMFEENPEYTSDFIAKTLKRGEWIKEKERGEAAKKLQEKWSGYIG